MRFSQKMAKLANGRAFSSAGNRIRRFLVNWRLPVKLEPQAIIDRIDRRKFEEIYARYVVDDPGENWPKYLDLPRWIDININRIRAVGLDIPARKRVLDLGCGAGYFAYVAQLLGHDMVGLDIDQLPMFAESTRMLGVRRVIWRVRPFVPLPELGEKFDVVTAFMICFNNHKMPDLWGVPEWEFFLDDLAHHLKPRSRVWLEFNLEWDGTFYTPELRDYFESRGAKTDNQKVIFTSGVLAPLSASPVAR
ncbi:MAG TPA: class I SAM-dependent methyltransferase [Chthoniobacterales bacterium]|nr:class I SAM-dependent methyltransferase [Chthoniobacterales bacterium]